MMVEPLPRWEYHVEPRPQFPAARLNELGAAGWELTGIAGDDEDIYLFRKPVQSFVERITLEQRATYYASLGLDPEGNR